MNTCSNQKFKLRFQNLRDSDVRLVCKFRQAHCLDLRVAGCGRMDRRWLVCIDSVLFHWSACHMQSSHDILERDFMYWNTFTGHSLSPQIVLPLYENYPNCVTSKYINKELAQFSEIVSARGHICRLVCDHLPTRHNFVLFSEICSWNYFELLIIYFSGITSES
jgi:hypothetical protein